MKKNICIAGILIIAGITAVFGHGYKTNISKIKIGVLLPLSSDFAWWGEAIINSIKTAQANGYVKDFEFVYEDTKCNTKDAVSVTQSMKALHPTMHLFIVGCDNDLKAMIPILNKTNDLAFMVGLSGADLYESGFPIINLAYRLEAEGKAAAEFAHKKLGVNTIGVLTDNGNFGSILSASVSEYTTSVGGSTVVEYLKYNQPNPETSILKVIKSNPDAVYIQNDIPTISTILKRLNQMNYSGKRIVYYGGRDQSLIDTAGKAALGVYVPWVISDTLNSDRVFFEKTFKENYGKEPFVTAYFVYDGLMLLDKAHKACDIKIQCIEQYFYDVKDFSGTLGSVEYKLGGEVNRKFFFQQIRDGVFVEVE